MPPAQPHRLTISRIDPRSRKFLAVVVVLVLAIVSVLVAGREVQAKEQPAEQAPQQQHSKVVITDRGASKSDHSEAPRNDAEIPRSETPPEEEPSPPPVGSVPSDPEPAPVPDPVVPDPPRPTPIPTPQQQFAVIIVNGQVVWFDAEAPWPWPVPDTDPADPVPWPAPGDAWPTTPQPMPSDQYDPQMPGWKPEPVPPPSEDIIGSASDPAPWPGSEAETPLLAPVSSDLAPTANPDPASSSWPTLSPEPIASWGNGPLPGASYAEPAVERPVALAPVVGTGLGSAATAKNNLPAYVAPLLPSPGRKPLATPPTPAMSSFPVGLGRVTSTVGNAAETVRSAASAALRTISAEVSGALAGGSVGSPDAAQDPSQGTPQQEPAPPLAPPMGGSSFSLSSGSGGHAGPGGGAAPLLVGILASVLVLRRHDYWKYLASCDLPKPSSARLLPLERPG